MRRGLWNASIPTRTLFDDQGRITARTLTHTRIPGAGVSAGSHAAILAGSDDLLRTNGV